MSYLVKNIKQLQAYSDVAVKRPHSDDSNDIFESQNDADDCLQLHLLKKLKIEMDPVNPSATMTTFRPEQQAHDEHVEKRFVTFLVPHCSFVQSVYTIH